MKKKVLITGANGFVGKYYENYSKTNFEISKLSIRYKPNQYFEFNYDVILHLAGIAHELNKKSDSKIYLESNYLLTKQIFDSFLNSNASVFIFMSTVKAVADNFEGILNEDEIENPTTDYGQSKLMAEKYIRSCNIPKGKRFYILRPCMIHGPGNKGNLNLLFSVVTKFKMWPLTSYDNKRSLCSVDNLCFVINELINNSSIPFGVYNVADDNTISTNEIIEIIENVKKTRIYKMNIPKVIIHFFFKIGDIFKLGMNTLKLKKLTDSFIVSNKKIKNVINSDFPISIREGLFKTILSFDKN